MIYNCQRKSTYNRQRKSGNADWQIHRIEAPDAATARVMMYNRSYVGAWLDHDKTDVWSDEEWIAT